jgi:bifunctional enzyme CysN/CysC
MDVGDIKKHGIKAYLEANQHKTILRFITCGSVDDGKSSLIGRLLYEAKLIYADQLALLEADSKAMGTQAGKLDLALLVDGLAAEREQGITIDVAYRYFSTSLRKFIVADTPGHEQYTRNMVTGASTADAAVILVDASKGVLRQTRRHSYLCSLLGIRHLILTINKMDLVGYDQSVYETIRRDYLALARDLGISEASVVCIPVSAVVGDNVVKKSPSMPWYTGSTLLSTLETLEVERAHECLPFRLPVQWVNRPTPQFRGFTGQVASGSVKRGDLVTALPSDVSSRIRHISGPNGELDEAVAGQSITIQLEDEVDVSRGDLLVRSDAPAQVGDRFRCTIIWMHEEPMFPGRPYLMKLGARSLQVTVTEPRYKVNIDTFAQLATKKLDLNDIGVCNIQTDTPIPFDPYTENRETGSFILIDRMSNSTVGAGLLSFALWRSDNVQWQALDVHKQARSELKGQKACVIWFTGLSGAGKSTIANVLERALHGSGRHTYLLDGDNVRHGLNNDLGFTDADRVENIRRVTEVAKLMVDAGLIVLVSFISPFRSERRMAREALEPGEFIEVFVDTPLAEAEKRDPKGLYKKARSGQIKHFTGIDSPYEAPQSAEVHIHTLEQSSEQAVEVILNAMRQAGKLDTRPPSRRGN